MRQARSLLGTCARLREVVGAAAEDLRPDRAGTPWAATLELRLLAEERKLLVLIAALPGANRVRLAEKDELSEYLDPDLLRAVTELAGNGRLQAANCSRNCSGGRKELLPRHA